MSHNHTDHTQVVVIDNAKDKDIKIIPGWVQKGKKTDWDKVNLTYKDVKVRSIGLYHDTSEGFQYGKNTAFLLETDGWRILHLGDLGHTLSAEQLADIKKDGPIDVLMIPVGGIYSLNGREAKKVVKQIHRANTSCRCTTVLRCSMTSFRSLNFWKVSRRKASFGRETTAWSSTARINGPGRRSRCCTGGRRASSGEW